MKTDPAILLAEHALATLPDSITARKGLLAAVVKTTPRGHKVRTDAHLMLDQLTQHEATVSRVQASFPFLSTLTPQNQRNGTKA